MSEFSRIRDRCSSDDALREANHTFSRTLTTMGYDQRSVTHLLQRQSKARKRIPQTQTRYFMKMPYHNESLNKQIRRVFADEGLNIVLAQRSTTLRSALERKHKQVQHNCTLANCTLKSARLCHQSRVVYSIQCSSCMASYIGSTMRAFHVRLKEHLALKSGAVYLHKLNCKSPFTYEILDRAPSELSLRIKESFHIKSNMPTLNRRDELSYANALII